MKAITRDFIASEIGHFEKSGMSIEYYGQETVSTRNVILKFVVKTTHSRSALDRTTQEETSYIQMRMFKKFGEDELAQGNYNKSELNNFIAQTYYELIA